MSTSPEPDCVDLNGAGFLADCDARFAIEVLGSKWAVVTLFALRDAPKRPKELIAMSGGMSQKVLAETLRRLQSYGLVERRAFHESPPRVEYALTPLGQTLRTPIDSLTEWAHAHGSDVAAAFEADLSSGQSKQLDVAEKRTAVDPVRKSAHAA